jgi:two-component system, NarL family, response regulator LiaR
MKVSSQSGVVTAPSLEPGTCDAQYLTSPRDVKILLVDDHEIIRKGLHELIDGHFGWKVCGEAGNGKEAVEKALALNPDIVVIDLLMPVMDGIEATKQIRQLCPATKIVMVSMYDSQQPAAEKAGANAYVSKTLTWRDLRDAISCCYGR